MIEVENVTFAYPGGAPVIADVSLGVPRGSFVSVIGRNASGKSTLAKLLNGLLLPLRGRVLIDGLLTSNRVHLWDVRSAVQLVFQNPENQLVGATVEEDIAFGLENLGVQWPEMGERIDWALDFARLRSMRSLPVSQLSGGEKQRVALAGVLAMRPRCVVLDEATSMLDEEGREELLRLMHVMNKEMGMTIVQITQNLEEVLESDRILVLDSGRIALDGAPSSIFASPDQLVALGLIPPTVVRLGQELARIQVPVSLPTLRLRECVRSFLDPSFPLSRESRAPWIPVKAGMTEEGSEPNSPSHILSNGSKHMSQRKACSGDSGDTPDPARRCALDPPTFGEVLSGRGMQIELKHVSYCYNHGRADEVRALVDVQAVVGCAETLAILGRGGSGKSTLLQIMNGLLQASGGQVLVDGELLTLRRAASIRTRVAMVFQYPEHQLFAATVFDDIAFAARRQSLDEAEVARRLHEAAAVVGLDLGSLGSRRPLELSGGERRKVAIAGAIVTRPALLLLDEPMAGLDPLARRELAGLIRRLRAKSGVGVVLVSHSLEEALTIADRLMVLDGGMVVFDGGPGELLRQPESLARWGLKLPMAVQFLDMLRSGGMEVPRGIWHVSEVVAAVEKVRRCPNPLASDGAR
ncbi:MAG: ATP-binding cassette domain-containing protein [Chloroflexota bacterium]|nr:MAG: ATP-binding cassette domain-containing protein [Chloroflexota bacterium]